MRFKEFIMEQMFESCTIQTSDLPESLKSKISSIQAKIPKSALCTKEDSKGWVKDGLQELMHITILFGVQPNCLNTVKDTFKTSFPNGCSVLANKLSHFDNEEEGYSVAVIGCESKDLSKLHYSLKEQLTNKHKFNYKAHCTIAYLKLGERLVLRDFPPIQWVCKNIEVSMPDGKIVKV